MRKGKVDTAVHIFNCKIYAEFEATLLDDGTLILEYFEPIVIPPGKFKIAVMRDMR